MGCWFWQGKVKYVHQLQNLYFALTGEELTKTNKMKETIFDFLVNYIACWYVGATTLLLMDVTLWYVLPIIIATIPAVIMTKEQTTD